MRKEFNVHRIVLVPQHAMTAVSLFRNTNMAAVTPSENAITTRVNLPFARCPECQRAHRYEDQTRTTDHAH